MDQVRAIALASCLRQVPSQNQELGLTESISHPSSWNDDTILESLSNLHSGLLCLLVFDTHLHPLFSEFVRTRGHDMLGSGRIMFLLYTPARPFAITALERLLSPEKVSSRDETFFIGVRDLFADHGIVAFPGLMFFSVHGPREAMVYVTVSKASRIEDLANIVSAAVQCAEEGSLDDRWWDSLGVRLAWHDIACMCTHGPSIGARTVRLIRTVWRLRTDFVRLLK